MVEETRLLGAFFSTPTPTPHALIKKTSTLITRGTQMQEVGLGCFAQPYTEHIHATCMQKVVVKKLVQMFSSSRVEVALQVAWEVARWARNRHPI